MPTVKRLICFLILVIALFPLLGVADETDPVNQSSLPSDASNHSHDDFWKQQYLLQREQQLQQQKSQDELEKQRLALDREKLAMAHLKRRDQRIAELQQQCAQSDFFKSNQPLCQKINNHLQFGIPISDADLGVTTEVPQTPSYQIDQHAIANSR
jgi:hypothetical protein